MMPVPFHALLELDTFASKDIQRAADRQVHFPTAELVHRLEISDGLASPSICHW